MPLIFVNILADVNVKPWPAWTSSLVCFLQKLLFEFFWIHFYTLFLFIRLQSLPVCISTQSASNFFASFISFILGSMKRLILDLFFLIFLLIFLKNSYYILD